MRTKRRCKAKTRNNKNKKHIMTKAPKIVQNQHFSTKIIATDAEKREESKNKIKNKKNNKNHSTKTKKSKI